MQFCRKGTKIVDIVYTCTQPVGVYISFTLCTTSYAFSARIRILGSTVHHIPFRVKAGVQYHTQQIKQKCLALLYLPRELYNVSGMHVYILHYMFFPSPVNVVFSNTCIYVYGTVTMYSLR